MIKSVFFLSLLVGFSECSFAQSMLFRPSNSYEYTLEQEYPFSLENFYGPTINASCHTQTAGIKNVVYFVVHNGTLILDGHWLKKGSHWYLTVKNDEYHEIKVFAKTHVDIVNHGKASIVLHCLSH